MRFSDDPDIAYALKCYHADDYESDVEFESAGTGRLTVAFRRRTAFEAARGRNPPEDRRGHGIEATYSSAIPQKQTLFYELAIDPRVWHDPRWELYLYGGGEFRRIRPGQLLDAPAGQPVAP